MKKTGTTGLAKLLDVPRYRALEAIVKAELISAVIADIERRGIAHAALATRAQLSRTTVTGILSGRVQQVTFHRILRLVDAADLEPHIKVKRAA